jgi:hypothetical protein
MDDVEALSTIVGILRNLDDETQKRVLASVEAFLGVKSQNLSGLRSRQDSLSITNEIASSNTFSEDRTISPKDFVRDKQPASDIERVACLGYYLSHYRNTTHFKTVDISSLNVEAAQPKFSNASVAVDNARARGLLVASTKGSKQMSALGEKYVELLPDREAAKASLSKIKPRRAVKKVKIRQGR